jgi:hypothetical protein
VHLPGIVSAHVLVVTLNYYAKGLISVVWRTSFRRVLQIAYKVSQSYLHCATRANCALQRARQLSEQTEDRPAVENVPFSGR